MSGSLPGRGRFIQVKSAGDKITSGTEICGEVEVSFFSQKGVGEEVPAGALMNDPNFGRIEWQAFHLVGFEEADGVVHLERALPCGDVAPRDFSALRRLAAY